MKKVLFVLIIFASTISLYACLTPQGNNLHESYDMPTKCSTCGQWHIPGTPCLN